MLYFVVGYKVQHTTVTNVNDPLSITAARKLPRDLLAKSI